MAGGRPAAGADDGGGGATAARRRLPYAAALCAFALAGGAAVRLQRPLGLGSPASAPRSSRGASSPGGADRAARRPARAAARRSAARLDRDGGGGDGGPLPLDEIEVASTEAPTLAPSNCSLSYSEFAESLETEVYGSCPWNAAAATAGEQMWFEDCLAVLNGTIAQCAFQGCATCGHYATCGDLEASPAPYADCVTCPDGYEVDVVYEDCSACVLEGFAVNPAATTDVTYFATSAVALDGITPDAITYDAGAVADIEAALVIALAPYVNGSAFASLAASAIASTLIGFDFYHWASVAGDGGDAALANASAAFASDYYDAATTAVDDLETDSTADVATALEVVVSSALVFSGVDSDTFNDDVDAVAEFKDVIAALWPNVTADYVYEVSASLDGSLTSIAYSFYDYFWLASNATADDAALADADYVAAYAATVIEAATSGDLQTLVDDATAGRRRLSSTAFDGASVRERGGAAGHDVGLQPAQRRQRPHGRPDVPADVPAAHAPADLRADLQPVLRAVDVRAVVDADGDANAAPSYVPTDGACDADYCWADETVAEFGCSDNTHVFPCRSCASPTTTRYSVLELEYEEGNYDLMYDIEYFDGHINAAAMFNAAAIIGNTYYYAKNFGNNIQNSHIYWVGDIHTDRPDFHDGHEFTMSPELYKSSVLDFVAVEEYGAEMIVDMYDEDGTYLVGIALGYEVVVVHVNRATKKPDKYAVLDAVVDWGDADDHSDDDNSFGAAFAYKLLRHADLYASYRLFFASNEGYGIMELATGFEIPDDCWNEGDDVENHAKCDATVALNYLGPSEPTHYNDGLNCPNGDFVMRYDDASLYGAYELNFDDGAYHLLYELDYFDGHINAVALYDGGKKGYYAMGSFGGYLCRFDAAAKVCFDDALEFSSPNVGAIVDKRYYYAKNLGEADDNGEIFWVDLIHTDEPEFYADSAFAEDGDELFDDRYADAGYLVGLSTDFELLVVHLSGQSGYPDAYAVFDSQVDFDGFDPADDDTGGFGASFVYNADGDTKIYFTANSGQGLFELALPVAVPDSCWNAGFDTDAHGVCDVVVGIRRVSASAPTNYNDGMNCPEFFEAAPSTEPTPEPTPEPRPSRRPSPRRRRSRRRRRAVARWSDASIDAFDCEAYQEPIQVLKYDGADAYTVRELDIDTGVYSEVEDLSWFDGHINAAAIFTGGDPTDLGSSNYAMASFGGYLCRFDAASKVCFDTPLEYESPNVGAIVGTNYYYAKNVGRDGGEGFYYVGEINGDAPFFYEDATFGVSEDLYTGAVLDVAAVEEHDGDTKVIDGEGGRGYLVGLGGAYELLVVRLGEETGEPEAYAVLESSVDWGDDLEFYDDGETSFGAAYAYLDIVGSTPYPSLGPDACGDGEVLTSLRFFPDVADWTGVTITAYNATSGPTSADALDVDAFVAAGTDRVYKCAEATSCVLLEFAFPDAATAGDLAYEATAPDEEVYVSFEYGEAVQYFSYCLEDGAIARAHVGPDGVPPADAPALGAADRRAGAAAHAAPTPAPTTGGLITCSEELSVISGLAYAPYVDFEYVDEYGDPSCGAHFRRSEFNVDTRRRRTRRPLLLLRRDAEPRADDDAAERPAVKIPTAAPSEAPTTAKPSTVAPTDMPLVSEPPTTTPAPSPAPTATAAPTAAPTAACQDTANWIVSDDLSCVDACDARGAYTDDGIRKSAWSQVDKLRELGELVYELTGVECSYVSSEVTDDPNAPYFEYDADNEGSNKYACYAKDGGDVGNDAPSEGMYLLCYCCGELPTPAPSYPPTDAPTLEPSTSHPTYAPTVSLAPTTYEHWFENTYSYSYTHPPSYDPTVYTSLAPTTSETVSGYYVVYVYYDFGVDADDEGDAAAFGQTVVGVSDIVVGTEEVTLDLTTTDDADADDARRLEKADGGDDGDDYVASAYAGVATVVVSAEYHESTDAAAKIAEAMTAALEDGSFIDLFIDEVRATGGALAELSDESSRPASASTRRSRR
ncbi:DNA binding protein [Aureococcus anophagefferens]|nr:DNA binding protein [Aureococcus anophagefferens]